jgi:hypothetical protein
MLDHQLLGVMIGLVLDAGGILRLAGAAGHTPDRLTSITESAFALLPRPRHH